MIYADLIDCAIFQQIWLPASRYLFITSDPASNVEAGQTPHALGLHLADLQFQLHTAVQKVSVYEYITSIYNLYFYSPGLGGKQK